MKAPKVDISIIITCYKKEEYLEECLLSVERQTRQPAEVVIIHDGCESPTAHKIAHTIILPDNVGVSRARNVGVNYTKSSLILFLDGDDVLSPDYLEKMVLVMAEGVDVVYPDMYIWSGPESYLSVPPDVITPEYVKEKGKIPIPVTSLIKREMYIKLGGFKEMPVLEDMDFFVRAMCNGYISFKKAHTLFWYRRYQGTRNTKDKEKREEVLKNIISQI